MTGGGSMEMMEMMKIIKNGGFSTVNIQNGGGVVYSMEYVFCREFSCEFNGNISFVFRGR